jgi:superfamily I DNA/RNA helicase
MVLAGAGSGKTRVLVMRVAHLLTLGVTPSEILCLTFTRDAAHEMAERLEQQAGKAAREIRTATFHSLAWELIREEWAGRPGWLWLGFSVRPQIAETEPAQDDAPGLPEPSEELALDHLLPLAVRLLALPAALAAIRARWSHLLVDEFQDTDPLQLELLRLLIGDRRSLLVVGDDDQAIYGWRGALPDVMGAFLQEEPRPMLRRLEISYRCEPQILRVANRAIATKKGGLRKQLLPPPAAGWRTQLRRWGSPRRVHGINSQDPAEEALRLSEELRRHHRGTAWEGLAILARHNRTLEELAWRLRNLGIPTARREEESGVRLLTVHGAKGLEWDVVFLVGLSEGLWPNLREPAEVPEGGDSSPDDRDHEAVLGEELRLFYVGVTRARRELFLCHTEQRIIRGRARRLAPSRFLMFLRRWKLSGH